MRITGTFLHIIVRTDAIKTIRRKEGLQWMGGCRNLSHQRRNGPVKNRDTKCYFYDYLKFLSPFSPRQFQPLSAIEFFSNRPLEALEGHLFMGSHHGWFHTTVERLPTTSLPLSVLAISTRLGQPSVAQLITAKPPFECSRHQTGV